MLLLWVFLVILFHVCLCYAALAVPCRLMITLCDGTNFLTLLCSCDFAIFPYGVSGQVWHLIVLIPDLCHLLYFASFTFHYFFIRERERERGREREREAGE